HAAERREDARLERLAFGDLGEPGRALLLGLGEPLEALLGLEARDALLARLEVQAERALDGDLLKPEGLVREDLAVLALLEAAEGLHHPVDVRLAELLSLVAETLAHLLEAARGVDELDLALA